MDVTRLADLCGPVSAGEAEIRVPGRPGTKSVLGELVVSA